MTAPTFYDVKTLLQHHADTFDLVDGRDANGVLLSDYYRVALAALEKADEVEAARGNLILQTICRLPEVLTEGDWQRFLDEHRDEWLSDDRAFGGWISERMRAALADAERLTWIESRLTNLDSVLLSAGESGWYGVDELEGDVPVRTATGTDFRAAIDAARRVGV